MRIRLVVGLTGSYASGKSTVARLFRKYGASVIDVDSFAREVLNPGIICYRKTVKYFGSDILKKDGSINRRRLADEIFSDTKKRKALENITHPEIIRRIKHAIAQIKKGLIIVDAPLLFESGLDKYMDKTIVVSSPDRKIYERASNDRGIGISRIKEMLRTQLPVAKKIKRADYVIDNSAGVPLTAKSVKNLYRSLTKISCLL